MNKTNSKISIPVKKPRNPMVVPCSNRKAGKHKDKKRESKNNPTE